MQNEWARENLQGCGIWIWKTNRHLSSFGLQRYTIISDGNFLFRSISFSLNGHQDIHQELRNLAVETLRGNVYVFQNYFLDEDDEGKPDEHNTVLANSLLMKVKSQF